MAASMTFNFMDVGMGDSTFVQMRADGADYDELALVDFGEQKTPSKVPKEDALTYLRDTIKSNSDNRKFTYPYLDALYLTHPHGDHYNRVEELLSANFPGLNGKLQIGAAYYSCEYGNYPSSLMSALSTQSGGKLQQVGGGQLYHSPITASGVTPFNQFAGNAVDVYMLSANWPSKSSTAYNAKCLVLMFKLGTHKVILGADAEEGTENYICQTFDAAFLNSYGLKLGHHGSKAASGDTWRKTVDPKAIFATGDMFWSHPYCRTICRFDQSRLAQPDFEVWYCCGAEGRQYWNNKTDRAVCLNLWYIVTQDQERFYNTGTEMYEYEDTGMVLGVQWALQCKDGKTPSFLLTDREVPEAAPVPFDCSSATSAAPAGTVR